MNNYGFDNEAYAAFQEAAAEKYDFGSCREGEMMVFGRCAPTSSQADKNKAEFEKKAAADRKKRAEKNIKKYPPSHKLHKQAKKDLAKG